jgi:hypothetical protein
MENRNYKVEKKYMHVMIEDLGERLSFNVWMSACDFWFEDADVRPFEKNYITPNTLWKVRSNRKMSLQQFKMVCEYADKILIEQRAKNEKRKLANR